MTADLDALIAKLEGAGPWMRQSCNNAAIAVRYGANGAAVMKAIRDGYASKRPHAGVTTKDLALRWLQTTAASARQQGLDADTLAHCVVAHLWTDELLSEGQGAKLLGIDRIDFRKLCDDYRDAHDEAIAALRARANREVRHG